jgi:hypothetical protein
MYQRLYYFFSVFQQIWKIFKIEGIASSIKEIFTSEYSSLNMKTYIPVRRDEFVGTMVS